MTSRSSGAPAVRLWRAGGRLLCRLSLPRLGGASPALVLVASARAPHLRSLLVYRRPAAAPDDRPQAA